MEQQPSLFPEHEPQPVEPVDVDEMAARIAANARPVEYEDRTSEAARDQGHGPIEVSRPETSEPTPRPQRLFELPGKNGRNNWYNQPPTQAEINQAWSGMTEEEKAAQIETNRRGAEVARTALRQARDNNS